MSLTEEAIRQLRALKGKELLLGELVECTRHLIPLLVGKQVRYKVTDIPDVRTVRYYVQRGLIDKPSHRGRQAVFGYRHLLQLLVVKKLQSGYLPLKKIGEATRSCDPDLEDLFTGEWAENKLLRTSSADLRPSTPTFHPEDDRIGLTPLAPLPPTPEGTILRRFKIDDGLELLVDEHFGIRGATARPGVIAGRIMRVLSGLATGGGDWALRGAGQLASLVLDEDVRIFPAPPVPYLSDAVVALITEGGLVPRGNPDGLESHRATSFFKYNIEGIVDLKRDAFESVSGGWDTTYVNADPDRLLPLDVMRELELMKVIGKTYRYFYTTTGVAMSIDVAKKIGKALAADLKREGVTAAIITAT
jgi:DNA-binding transcriptional MerR regulator